MQLINYIPAIVNPGVLGSTCSLGKSLWRIKARKDNGVSTAVRWKICDRGLLLKEYNSLYFSCAAVCPVSSLIRWKKGRLNPAQ